MFKKILKSLWPILVIVFSGYFTYYINRTQPDVRYTLSQGIPVSFLGTSSGVYENIQQLEVKNIGNARAETVVLKIEGQLTSYELVKYAASDVVEVFDQQQPIEIIYPGLPPQAGFKLIFKSPASIEYDDLSITHNAGIAKEALSKPDANVNKLIIVSSVYILILGGMLFYMVKSSIESSFDSWKTREACKNLEKVLSLSKPWYIADDRWKTVHIDIVSEKLKGEYLIGRDIANSTPYRILSAEKPNHLDSADWNEIVLLAVDRLEKACSELVRGSLVESEIMTFLRFEKPKYFPQGEWQDLKKRANISFVEFEKRNDLLSGDLVQSLKQEKPTEVSETSWIEVVRNRRQQYYDTVMRRLQLSTVPLETLSEYDLSLLDKDQRQNLEIWASDKAKYGELNRLFTALLNQQALDASKPEVLNKWEWQQFQLYEEGIKKLTSDKAKYGELNRLFTALLSRQPLDASKPEVLDKWEWQQFQLYEEGIKKLTPEAERIQTFRQLLHTLLVDQQSLEDKPASLTDAEWRDLTQYEKRLKALNNMEARAKEIESESLRIAMESEQILLVREKVERQLKIIHELLDDPSVIDRIESYDDTFAPGNLESLERVASILREASQV